MGQSQSLHGSASITDDDLTTTGSTTRNATSRQPQPQPQPLASTLSSSPSASITAVAAATSRRRRIYASLQGPSSSSSSLPATNRNHTGSSRTVDGRSDDPTQILPEASTDTDTVRIPLHQCEQLSDEAPFMQPGATSNSNSDQYSLQQQQQQQRDGRQGTGTGSRSRTGRRSAALSEETDTDRQPLSPQPQTTTAPATATSNRNLATGTGNRHPMIQRILSTRGRLLNGRDSASQTHSQSHTSSHSHDLTDREENGSHDDELLITPVQTVDSSRLNTATGSPTGIPRLISDHRARFDDSPRPVFIPVTNSSSSNYPMMAFATDSIPTSGGAWSPRQHRRLSSGSQSSKSDYSKDWDDIAPEMSATAAEYHSQIFFPPVARDFEWMGRSIESLILGHAVARAPILQLLDDEASDDGGNNSYYEFDLRRRSTSSTFGGARRRSTAGSYQSSRRCSLSLSGHLQGGTMANYYNNRNSHQAFRRPSDVDRSVASERQGRRSSTANGPQHRRRSSMASTSVASINANDADETSRRKRGGPNVLFNIMARESTGWSVFPRGIPECQRLRLMGGSSLFGALDKPADGMATEVAYLAAAIDLGDWVETHAIMSRLVVRLVGDPSIASPTSTSQDPNLPRTSHRFYAGGGRIGLERDAFVLAGGVQVVIRMFREKSFVGQEMAQTYDARYLTESIVSARFASCWNEALASLRELVYVLPSLVESRAILDDGGFLPFLFTLLSHESCFDGAAALIEEILSFMSQTQQFPHSTRDASADTSTTTAGRFIPASTFCLGNIPDLYKLWRGFNCRQLAHFCRILALLIFEPEDRQLLESPTVLKSQGLLQLRRNRIVRAAHDSTVDMNQSILLGDDELLQRLLKLLGVMSYAPPIRRVSPYHVLAHYPFVADTIVMLGLNELDNWDEIDRQDRLARTLLDQESQSSRVSLSALGAVADMLDSLSATLSGSHRQPNQIGNIILVMSAAQEFGVIVGRPRGRNSRPTERIVSSANNELQATHSSETVDGTDSDIPFDGSTLEGLASVAGILTDQIMVRRLYNSSSRDSDDAADGDGSSLPRADIDTPHEHRHLIKTPEDAANSLQFNAMLFGPYQVEVMFVLCTLLGGRRKIDVQDSFNRLRLIPIIDDMFQRLPWYNQQSESSERASDVENLDAFNQPHGIHGPSCECTPESALCVQYLRMIHNFCDRDCDNYGGRQLLLSESEREKISSGNCDNLDIKTGLLSKIISAFFGETDESPYRFWLASCIESFLRGSLPSEQMFVADSGLLDFLAQEISSERLHCAGSLQTSFDLLGELIKGNANVIFRLVNNLDEESFKKLMSVAAANLVDSNVFIRSLLLSLERLSARNTARSLLLDGSRECECSHQWVIPHGLAAGSYLTHSWLDVPAMSLLRENSIDYSSYSNLPADWFPSCNFVQANTAGVPSIQWISPEVRDQVCVVGWIFTPLGDELCAKAYLPNTIERLNWFLAANQARLLRDLLVVIDLKNINHENICCLNTAVVITIFAHRRKQLASLLDELRRMSDDEKEAKRRAMDASQRDQVVDRAFAQAMRYLDLSNQERDALPIYARRTSLSNSTLSRGSRDPHVGDRTDVMRNFREVLWFWIEYYTHRGRDRLSLEFSSHIRFQEWNHVVSLLVTDNESPTSLVKTPICLPRSPYQRVARVPDCILRGD